MHEPGERHWTAEAETAEIEEIPNEGAKAGALFDGDSPYFRLFV
jgi:hypothetical protein